MGFDRLHVQLGRYAGLVVAVVLVFLTGVAVDDPEPVAFAFAALAGLAFTFHERRPRLTMALVTAALVTYLLLGPTGGPIFATLFGAAAVVAHRRPATRDWLVPTTAMTVVVVVALWIDVGPNLHVLPTVALVFATGKLVADARRSRLQADAARDQETARRLAEERLRITREVHDVVGHGLATITLRAGVADHVGDPDEMRAALRDIRAQGKESLAELKALLGVLRGDAEADADGRTPVPDLGALPRLADGLRAAGLDVSLAIDGGAPELVPDVLGTAAYRIVQEALTNVARHAGPGARAEVHVRILDDGGVEISVADDGAGPAGPVREGGGLTGMRERTSALGGFFAAGAPPEPDGRGFRVWAILPAPGTTTAAAEAPAQRAPA